MKKKLSKNKVFFTVFVLFASYIIPTHLLGQVPQDTLIAISILKKTSTSFNVAYTVGYNNTTSQGICYGLSDNLDLNGTHVSVDHWKSADTLTIPGLTPLTRYYFSIYAITPTDTIYGAVHKATTVAPEPTTNCGTPSVVHLDSCSVQISFDVATGANRYLCVLVEGNTPVNPELIESGVQPSVLKATIGCVDLVENLQNEYSYDLLNLETTYSLSVFPANRPATGYHNISYKTDGEISTITFETQKVTPTIQTSQISANAILDGKANISWVNGNGKGRVVYINNTNSFTDPTNGEYPLINNAYSGSGQQAIYNGSNSSVEVSGLSANTTYYFRAYEFNEKTTGNPMYNTSEALDNPTSFTYYYPAPEVQDSNIMFSYEGPNSVKASWLKGDGMNRIVVMNTSNVFTTPTNFTDYTANSSWENSGEQVVYNGNSNIVIVTNISTDIQYFFRVFAYNNESQYAMFNTSTAIKNPNSIKLSPPLIQDFDIEFSNVTATSATVNWTRGDGMYSIVCMNIAENYLTPEDFITYNTNSEWQNSGAQWVYSGDQTSVDITGLTLGTTYYFTVYAFNNSDYPIYNTSPAIDNPYSLQLGGLNTWNGNISENWEVAKNWSLKHVPFNENNVIIPEVTNHPVLSQNSSVKNLTLTSKGRLTVEEGGIVLSVNGTLYLKGDAISSGSLVIRGSSSVDVTGESYLTRKVTVKDWHIASIPNNNNNALQFTGFHVSRWIETTSTWVNLGNLDIVEKMKGYAIYPGSKDTVRFRGSFNNGPQSIDVTNSKNGHSGDGWNFMGNPYPSAIDWGISEGWSRENINNTIYKNMENAGFTGYVTYNYETGVGVPEGTNGIIPASNGFYVLLIDSTSPDPVTATLGINNNARVHSYDPYIRNSEKSTEKILRLSIFDNESAVSETAILFHPKALNEINTDIDAFVPPLFPEVERPQIFSIRGSNNTQMILSSINENLLNTLEPDHFIEVPIGLINNRSLSYRLVLNGNTIGEDFDVYLYNKKTDKYHNLEQPYSLSSEDENSYNTFSVRITPKGGNVAINNTPNNKIDIDVFAVKDVININSREPITGTVTVYDITGKLVFYEQLNGVNNHTIKNDNKTGIFIVVINGEQGYYSKKLFVE